MKYQTYAKYKPSGVEWIGEIPEEWQTIKLKRISRIETGTTPSKNDDRYYDEGDFLWIKPDELGSLEPIIDSKTKLNIEGKKLARRIPKNSILVCCIGSVGKIGIAGVELATNQQINSVIPDNKKFNYSFAKYILLASEEKIKSIGNSNVVAIVNKAEQGEISYSLPPFSDQQKISDFLDKKAKQIDDLIEKDKKLIGLLKEKRVALINKAVTRGLDDGVKFKDSGVEWIGEIPEGWGVRKLKFLTIKKAQYGANSEPEVNENHLDFRYIRITDVNDKGGLKEDSFAYLRKKDALGYMLQEGDILFARSGATVGKVYYYTEQDGKCCFAGYMIRYISNIKKLIPKFLLYYSLSKSYQEWIKIISTQSTIENVSAEKYDDLLLPVPTLDEQKLIINYLDKQTIQADNHIEKIIRRIDLLEEYKKSLIYNAVTGKIRV